MRAFADNDVLVKLVKYGQLESALELLKRRHSAGIHVQATLASSCDFDGRNEKPRLVDTVEQREALKAAVKGLPILPVEEKALAILPTIPRGPRIQSGDAIWLAVGAAELDMTIYTGDKKALIEVATSKVCASVSEALQGRCVWFPQIVLKLIEKNGIHAIRRSIAAAPACDAGVSSAFPHGVKTPQSDVIALLEKMIEDARAHTHGLLLARL